MGQQFEKPDRIGLRVVALVIIVAWVSLTLRYWQQAVSGLVIGWVIIAVTLWRLGRPDRERDQRQRLLIRLAADMRAAAEPKD